MNKSSTTGGRMTSAAGLPSLTGRKTISMCILSTSTHAEHHPPHCVERVPAAIVSRSSHAKGSGAFTELLSRCHPRLLRDICRVDLRQNGAQARTSLELDIWFGPESKTHSTTKVISTWEQFKVPMSLRGARSAVKKFPFAPEWVASRSRSRVWLA